MRLADDWAVVAETDPRPITGLGWQGLLRHLAAGDTVRPQPPKASPLALSARLVVMSRDDAVPGTQPDDMALALDPAARLVWTEGADGGLVIQPQRDGRRRVGRYEAIPSGVVVDPTGAGDVFLAAMFAAMLKPGMLAAEGDDTTFAAAAASLVVEAPGLAGVPDLAAVRARMTRAPSLVRRRASAVSNRARGRPSQA